MVAAVFAALFGWSLLPGRSPLCLRFAERISDGIMPEGAEDYCRRLTWLWFFVLAALAAANAALFARGLRLAALPLLAVVPLVFFLEKLFRNRRFSVAFHTSGSTGRSKTVVKTFESLAREVALHRRHYVARFGAEGARSLVFLGTVQRDHMYGRLWMDMLPKALGAAADPDVIRTPEELISKMVSAGRVVLVTTPSFLERLCAYAGQYDVPRTCVEVVTSGALLTREASAAAARVFGVEPRQIFGSTETGGVADRRFPDESFRVFDPVRVAVRGGRLEVRSPFSFRRRYLMGDGAALAADGRSFRLLGRVDRLVKINEERVNLAEAEEKVRALGFADCALAKIAGRHGDFLGCLLVARPSAARPSALELRRMMLPVFPKGTVPRRFRFVGELPRNAQGKVVAADVERLLDAVEVTFSFTGDEPFFRGHFPGHPVLPGVVQLSFAVREAKKAFGFAGEISEAKKVKFDRVVEPGQTVTLALSRKGPGEVAYEFRAGEARCSSGLLVF
ncbi:MAG: acyl-CoA synthetase [Kiritimatiellae bacterium]|nr:acyl-CoA synthetase [Kiritimatiellia bacterium]